MAAADAADAGPPLFPTTPTFTDGVAALNSIGAGEGAPEGALDKLPLALSRVLSAAPTPGSRPFSGDEAGQLGSLLGLPLPRLSLALECAAYVFEVAGREGLKAGELRDALGQEAGMAAPQVRVARRARERARARALIAHTHAHTRRPPPPHSRARPQATAFAQVWASDGPAFLAALRARLLGAPGTLAGASWRTLLRLGSSGDASGRTATAVLSLTIGGAEGDGGDGSGGGGEDRGVRHLQFDRPALVAFMASLDAVAAAVDALS